MGSIFLTKIKINKVRHLKNLTIPLSENKKKHLILTGKNGSGKTSVLEALSKMIDLNNHSLRSISLNIQAIQEHQKVIESFQNQIEKVLKHNDTQNAVQRYEDSIKIYQDRITANEKQIQELQKKVEVSLNYPVPELIDKFAEGRFIETFFPAKRNLKMSLPTGIQKVNLPQNTDFQNLLNQNFLQYIVNLKVEEYMAHVDKDRETVERLEKWFNDFEALLKDLFEDETLTLEFDRKNYTFNILTKGHEPFGFNKLADGYSALFHIVTELIMRMENKRIKGYDITGIVLIDEIETHLHIALQKKVLPLLTAFFPGIQFIVSTHSPFVLNSVKNTVIYDLENKTLLEDLSGYSYDGIVESYFENDKYSDLIKEKIARYEKLVNKEKLTDDEEDQLIDLRTYLKNIPPQLAPELSIKFKNIEFKRKEKQVG